MEFPPHWMDPEPLRAYLLNFYTIPEARGTATQNKSSKQPSPSAAPVAHASSPCTPRASAAPSTSASALPRAPR
jgi:hypothetical protein